MATENQVDTLNGLFKEVYADKINDLTPEGLILYNDIPFIAEDKRNGNLYHVPVVLGSEHGFTYGGSNGDAFNLSSAIAGKMKDATVQGYEMILRSQISVGAISRSLKGGKAAFENASKHLVSNMLKSISKRLEIQLMYGQSDIGVIDSVSVQDIVITAASFAPGIWAGAENMVVEVYTAAGADMSAELTVSAVDFATRTITLVGTMGDIAAADTVHFRGARTDTTTFNEFIGVDKIISQSTGNLFGISTTAYSLWNGNSFAASGALTLDKVNNAIELAVQKGLTEQEVVVVVNPSAWNQLLTEQTALRQFDTSYSSDKYKNGSSSIELFGQNGKIAIKPSIYCKEGEAFVLCMEEFVRVGSRDISFDLPGFEGEFIFALEGKHAYEMRAYTDQALLCTSPSKNVKITGIS